MLIEQTKTKQQKTIDLKLNKPKETFSFIFPKNLSEEEKLILALTAFEATISVFILTDENISFSVSSPRYWTPKVGEEITIKWNDPLELRSQNDNDSHVKEVEKRSTQLEIENSGYNSASFDPFKSEILADLRIVKFKEI